MVVGVVRLACRVDMSRLDSRGVTNGIRADLRDHGRVRAKDVDMGFIACVGPVGCTAWHMCWHWAHGCVLRGNVPSHCLPGCGCVGPTRTSVPLRGVYVTSGLV